MMTSIIKLTDVGRDAPDHSVETLQWKIFFKHLSEIWTFRINDDLVLNAHTLVPFQASGGRHWNTFQPKENSMRPPDYGDWIRVLRGKPFPPTIRQNL
jgi:hypothetical protein